jgi:four helix bundle protein
MNKKVSSFEDLIVWQRAQKLARSVYLLAEQNSFIKKDFSFKDQLKRASLSVSDNIAEGFDYNNNADFYRFLRIAKGSCGEVRNKLLFLQMMEFADNSNIDTIQNDAFELGRQLGCLMQKVREKCKKPCNS